MRGGTADLEWGRGYPCACDRWSPPCWIFCGGEDTVRVDDDSAAADHGHAMIVSTLLRKRENRRRGAGEGPPLCLGLLVPTLLDLPLVSADGMGYCSATDVPGPQGSH